MLAAPLSCLNSVVECKINLRNAELNAIDYLTKVLYSQFLPKTECHTKSD